MEKRTKMAISAIGIIVVVCFILLFAAWFFGFDFNAGFNNPDKSCTTDSDCTVKVVECPGHCSFECVNKEWEKNCPFSQGPFATRYTCKAMNYTCMCVDGQCRTEG